MFVVSTYIHRVLGLMDIFVETAEILVAMFWITNPPLSMDLFQMFACCAHSLTTNATVQWVVTLRRFFRGFILSFWVIGLWFCLRFWVGRREVLLRLRFRLRLRLRLRFWFWLRLRLRLGVGVVTNRVGFEV
jgi:hypothetical protein